MVPGQGLPPRMQGNAPTKTLEQTGPTITLKLEHVDHRGHRAASRSRSASGHKRSHPSDSDSDSFRASSLAMDIDRSQHPIPFVSQWLDEIEQDEPYYKFDELRAKFIDHEIIDIRLDKLANFKESMFVDTLKLTLREQSIIFPRIVVAAKKLHFHCHIDHGKN
jgi:hypothetical protein